MGRLRRPDGAEIQWHVEGEEGPLVAIARMALDGEIRCQPFADALSSDHRVLVYDLRGCGASGRVGPYEIETDAEDLAAVVEEAGGGALAVALGDGARRAVRVAAARPDLIHTVAVSGELPMGPLSGRSGDALSDSPAVLHALVALLESDYRTGLRGMLDASGSEWEDAALRAHLDATEAYSPQEVGVARMRSWTTDDSSEAARALGERLVYLHYPGNAWFQGSLAALRRDLPQARFLEVSEGMFSSPAENAAAVRRLLSGIGSRP